MRTVLNPRARTNENRVCRGGEGHWHRVAIHAPAQVRGLRGPGLGQSTHRACFCSGSISHLLETLIAGPALPWGRTQTDLRAPSAMDFGANPLGQAELGTCPGCLAGTARNPLQPEALWAPHPLLILLPGALSLFSGLQKAKP